MEDKNNFKFLLYLMIAVSIIFAGLLAGNNVSVNTNPLNEDGTRVFTEPLDIDLQQARNVIQSTYGDNTSVLTKKKNLLKFGRNELVGTTEATIMTLPSGITEETFVLGNNITHIASTNNTDLQNLKVEGHIVNLTSGDLTFVVQSVTLAGQTKTALTTPLHRVTRAYNDDSTNLVGTIYIAEDVSFVSGVPSVNTAIKLIIPQGEQQSQKASTSLSSQDYWIITHFHGSVLEKTSAFGNLRLEVRQKGKVFRPVSPYLAVESGNTEQWEFKPYLIIPKNSDVRLRASGSGANTDISGGMNGYLAIITD